MTSSRGGRWLGAAVAVVLVVIGALTASPGLAVVQPEALTTSYGVSGPSPAELALLQHRGVLQFLVGAVLIWSAFAPAVRVPAAVVTIVSKSMAVYLFTSTPGAVQGQMGRNLVFDVVCVVLLLGVVAVSVAHRRAPGPREPVAVPAG